MEPKKLSLVEVFRSVQGEGYHSGRDAIFVRFAGCNLSCVFAEGVVCDTPYQQSNLRITPTELFQFIQKTMFPHPGAVNSPETTMMILTGGEPTLAPGFDFLVGMAQREGYYVAIETNGTRWRDGLSMADWVTVSPKDLIQHGSPSPHHNPNPQSPEVDLRVEELMTLTREWAGEYRYVVSSREDHLPPFAPAYRHYLSPAVMATGDGQEWKRGFPGFAPGAVERCLEIVSQDPRWRLSIQTHKILGVR